MVMLIPNRFRGGVIAVCLVAITVSPSRLAKGGAFAIHDQSVSGLGTAYAGGAAQAEDASTIFFNPAGIALLNEGEFQLGGDYILSQINFTNQGSRYNLPNTAANGERLSGGNGGDAGVGHVLPTIYLSQPVFRSSQNGDLAVGLGVSAPFGLETDYSPGWVGRYLALRSKLTTIDIEPSIAYRLFDRISFGASLDIEYASARLTQAIDFGLAGANAVGQFEQALPAQLAAKGVPPAAIPSIINATQQAYSAAGFVPGGRDGISEVTGNDWAVGFTLGAIIEYWKGDEHCFFQNGRFGVSYRSGISHTLTGNAQFRDVPAITASAAPVQFPEPGAFQEIFFDQNASSELDLPEIYHFSLYQAFAGRFAIMGDLNWTRWSSIQSIAIKFSSPLTPSVPLQFGYQDAIRYAIGLEWYATKVLTFRLGFAYDQTPITSADFRTPRLPDNDKYVLACGLRWSPTRWMDFDFGYSHLFIHNSQVDFTDNEGHNLRGEFQTAGDIFGAAVTFRWGGAMEMPSTAPKSESGKSTNFHWE